MEDMRTAYIIMGLELWSMEDSAITILVFGLLAGCLFGVAGTEAVNGVEAWPVFVVGGLVLLAPVWSSYRHLRSIPKRIRQESIAAPVGDHAP